MTTLERVRNTIAAVLGVPQEDVASSALLAEITALDSLKLVEIVAALDEEFQTRLPSDDLASVQSVEDLVRLVERSS
jgi:acyl carrier protein